MGFATCLICSLLHVPAQIERRAPLVAEATGSSGVQNVPFRSLGRKESSNPTEAEAVADELEHVAQHLGVRAQRTERVAPRLRPAERVGDTTTVVISGQPRVTFDR